MPDDDGYGALASALAKAQMEFPPVLRGKEVEARAYKFKYAPLDAVLAAVRGPLAKNGLAISQLLDGDDLVTMLLHEGGARLYGRAPLPYKDGDTIQALGSAITYMRRYALQAILGIAAEEDDDGEGANKGKGKARYPGLVDGDPDLGRPELERRAEGLVGTVAIGKPPVDLNLRETPEGWAFGFKLTAGRKGYQALATGPLAQMLAIAHAAEDMTGVTAQIWGRVDMVPWQKDGRDMPPYPRIAIERVQTPTWTLPMDEADTAPLFPEEVPA